MTTETTSKSADQTASPLAAERVEDHATVGVLSCTADTPLREVAWLMANNRVHAVAVVDDTAPELPVISDSDLISALTSGHLDELRAIDVAATEAPSVVGEETLERAAQVMVEHSITHLIVRDARRVPVGVISTLDLARALGADET